MGDWPEGVLRAPERVLDEAIDRAQLWRLRRRLTEAGRRGRVVQLSRDLDLLCEIVGAWERDWTVRGMSGPCLSEADCFAVDEGSPIEDALRSLRQCVTTLRSAVALLEPATKPRKGRPSRAMRSGGGRAKLDVESETNIDDLRAFAEPLRAWWERPEKGRRWTSRSGEPTAAMLFLLAHALLAEQQLPGLFPGVNLANVHAAIKPKG